MDEGGAPRAVFMAFGTKGDVFPIAAIAAAFACDQHQYRVVLISHSAHENLIVHLESKNVSFIPLSTPPVLSAQKNHYQSDSGELSSLREKFNGREHKQECLSAIGRVFEDSPSVEGDFIAINFFALEGWHLAELFRVRCVVAAPYVVPYSAPSSFERQFQKELPCLYKYLQEAPLGKDPVTGLPMWHDRAQSPLLLYGFSKEIVECPGYWPSNVHVCGFWFPPMEWQFSCIKCGVVSSAFSTEKLNTVDYLCTTHADLQNFLEPSNSASCLPIFIGLSSIGSMGFLRNPHPFLLVIKEILKITNYKFVLFSSGYEPLNDAIQEVARQSSASDKRQQDNCTDGILLFSGRLFCFSGTIPYDWVFPRCEVVIHHGGSGSTAAALRAGTPQIICPFILDQFYWAERMFWLGVAPKPLHKNELLLESDDEMCKQKAAMSILNALKQAVSPEMKECASRIAGRISTEDGIGEALKVLKEHVIFQRETGN